MHGPEAVDRRIGVRVVADVHDPAGAAAADRHPNPAFGLVDDGEAEQPGHQLERFRRLAHEKGDAVQPPDRHAGGDATPRPRRSRIAIGRDQLEHEAGRIRHAKRLLAETRRLVCHLEPARAQPGLPAIEGAHGH